MLPDLDSNQDNQIQRLMYYHYTIGQCNKRTNLRRQKYNFQYYFQGIFKVKRSRIKTPVGWASYNFLYCTLKLFNYHKMKEGQNDSASILVIGSSNTDMVVKSDRIPLAGETILGGDFFMNPGGKGANQAVAAARLGGKVAFIARVGSDIFGERAIAHFSQEGIDT